MKNFDLGSPVIQHLPESNKWLVHACLEAPDEGIYYRGKTEILEDFLDINLPDYAIIGTDWTLHLASIRKICRTFSYDSEYGHGKFSWIIFGKRKHLHAEIDKTRVTVSGDGPYKYLGIG